jgi:undecaprenyl-diphosphatase
MTYLESVILGAIEGLTEFLPISSTGHLILASHLLGLPQTEFLKSFEIAIQLGSILAVVVLFWKSFFDVSVLKRLIVAFIPTGIVGFLLYRLIKDYLIGNTLVVIGALFIGGVAIILIEKLHRAPPEEVPVADLSYRNAFIVGLMQSLAVVPGVSRSGATVMGGLLLGIPRATILTFSFLLAVPTMIMATAYDLYKTPEAFLGTNPGLLAAGFLTAFVVALFTMRFALSFVRKHSFVPFGIYRIIVSLAFFLIIFG